MIPAKKAVKIENQKITTESSSIVSEPNSEINIEPKKPILEKTEKRGSSLSLKSVFKPKEVEKKIVEENFDDYPKTPFTKKQLELYWADYTSILEKKGEQSMASILNLGKPILADNFQISCIVSSTHMEDQFLKGRHDLLNFLRQKLNNYGIDILVTLDKTIAKKFAYTPQEKFNKMKEKNPMIEKLRQTFELDL